MVLNLAQVTCSLHIHVYFLFNYNLNLISPFKIFTPILVREFSHMFNAAVFL